MWEKNMSQDFDEISDDALKSGYGELKEALTHLFNIIYGQGVYPDAWCDGFIVPIHKKNNITDVNNYRGIIISCCIGKLFLRTITRRIEDFMISSHKWGFNQCSFKPDHRTEDSLFILNTIFESYVTKRNAKVYLAFVDFSKFFDTINRSYLLYKLLKYGITDKDYSLIKSMYAKHGIHSTCKWSCIPQIYREPWCETGLLFKPNIIKYISEWLEWDIFRRALWPSITW